MDYKTKPTSRRDLRCYSQILRKIFKVPLTGVFPVLEVLDKISDVFKDCNYEIVDDKKISPQTMARCTPNDQGGFTIEPPNPLRTVMFRGGFGRFCLI